MAKIFWNESEIDKILSKALLLMDTGLPPFEAIKRAQSVLQPDRRRSLNTYSACANLIKQLKNEHALHILKKKPAPLEPSPPPAAPVHLPEPVPALEKTLDSMATQLAKQLAAEFAAIFKESVRGAVEELVSEFKVAKHNPEYSSTKTRRQRIIIIGLLGDQVHSIDHEFGSLFDLKFIDTDRANGLTPPDADVYLLMKNFINHPLYYKYRGFPNHVLIDGGMTALRTWLHARANLIIAETNERVKAN